MNDPKRYKKRFGLFPLFALTAILILGAAVMLLWNAILPELTGVRTIRYWQAVGLLALCRILFGSFGGRMGPRGKWNHSSSSDPNTENPNETFFRPGLWRGKWMNMSEEERLRFKEEIRRRCGKPPRKE